MIVLSDAKVIVGAVALPAFTAASASRSWQVFDLPAGQCGHVRRPIPVRVHDQHHLHFVSVNVTFAAPGVLAVTVYLPAVRSRSPSRSPPRSRSSSPGWACRASPPPRCRVDREGDRPRRSMSRGRRARRRSLRSGLVKGWETTAVCGLPLVTERVKRASKAPMSQCAPCGRVMPR